MGKVKAKSVPVYIRASLLHMVSKNSSEGLLKKMGSTVIPACILPSALAYLKNDRISILEHSPYHTAYMSNFSTLKVNSILYLELSVIIGNHAGISLLSSHSSIKNSLVSYNRSCLTVCKRLNKICLSSKGSDPAGTFQISITDELS